MTHKIAFIKTFTLIFLFSLQSLFSTQMTSSEEKAIISEIDKHISVYIAENKARPNSKAPDHVFLKRAFLDIIGRIPTIEEFDKFMNSKSSSKRDKLIDYLHQTSGYVSHSYNKWADALRITGKLGKSSSTSYKIWVKQALASNMPYDQFVRELITAEGPMHMPGNGKVGYYQRDAGMRLENVAATMQLFLGTSMVCAQCHDHPRKDWSQLDFYQLAAFTNGMAFSMNNFKQSGETKKYFDQLVKKEGKPSFNFDKSIRAMTQGYYNSGTGTIKLPKDYAYKDGEPEQVIKAKVPFGPKVSINYNSDNGAPKRPSHVAGRLNREPMNPPLKHVYSKKYFAEWITSPENPMFTKTIVNRLWERVFGYELVGDMIDMDEDDFGPIPELTRYLITVMEDLNYDQKAFMKLLFKTNAYERNSVKDIGSKFFFQGPLAERLSAEQFHDSLLTLRQKSPDGVDYSKQLSPQNQTYLNLIGKSPKEMAKLMYESKRSTFVPYKQNGQDNDISYSESDYAMEESMMGSEMTDFVDGGDKISSQRASEIGQAKILTIFGASSRQIIDDHATNSNIPQALNLMNSPHHKISHQHQLVPFMNSKSMSVPQKIVSLYKRALTRLPTKIELYAMDKEIKKGMRVEDLYWVLINSHEFKFKI